MRKFTRGIPVAVFKK